MMLPALINLGSFNIVWFICVQGNNTLAALSTVLLLFTHCLFFVRSKTEIFVIAVFSTIGYTFDSLLATFSIIHFSAQFSGNFFGIHYTLAPTWLLCLWVAFSTTLAHSLSWLATRKVLAALLACIFSPLSYFAGAALSDSTLQQPVYFALALEACFWSALFPFGLYLSNTMHSNIRISETLLAGR